MPKPPLFRQRRRLPPAAETGRSCWGSGQQDASDSVADAGCRNPALAREAPERASPARKDRPCSDKQTLCQRDAIAAPSNHCQHPCPLSHLRCQLPQRGSPWHVGQVYAEQAKLDLSEAVVLRCLGQQQLNKVRLSRSRCPRKQGPPFYALSGLRRPVESGPACQWLPLWGSWRAKARLRGLFCKTPLQTSPRCGIIHLAASPLEIEYLPL